MTQITYLIDKFPLFFHLLFIIIFVIGLPLCGITQDQPDKEPRNDKIQKTYSPKGALLRSAFITGWGQLYNGKKRKTGVVVGLEGLWIYYARLNHRKIDDRQGENKDFVINERNKFLWLLGLTHIMSILDAFIDAHLSDFDEKMQINYKRKWGKPKANGVVNHI